MVVIIHASAQHWYTTAPAEADFAAMHAWNSAVRAAVPIFFMISGALFLSAPPPGKKLWTRNLPRLVSVYVIWSILYGVDAMSLSGLLAEPEMLFANALSGHYHLWFMPAMIGVYLLMPALYAVAHYDGGRALRPYLTVFAVFGILCGTVASLSDMLPWTVSSLFGKIVPELCGVCGYFLLGYALTKIDPAHVRRWPLLAIFAVSVTAVAAAGILYSRYSGTPTALLYGEFTLPTFAEAVCLFLLFCTVKTPPDSRTARVFAELSACTLGIYLLHPFVMEHLLTLGFGTTVLPAWLGVPAVSAASAVICLAVTAVLRRIPVLGKWIV